MFQQIEIPYQRDDQLLKNLQNSVLIVPSYFTLAPLEQGFASLLVPNLKQIFESWINSNRSEPYFKIPDKDVYILGPAFEEYDRIKFEEAITQIYLNVKSGQKIVIVGRCGKTVAMKNSCGSDIKRLFNNLATNMLILLTA